MKLNKTFLVILSLLYTLSYAQIDSYNYKKQLQQPSDLWHAIDLPNDIFKDVNENLNDIRIYGIKENSDTIEAPYLLDISREVPSLKTIDFKLINTSTNDKGSYFTFKINSKDVINHIALDFENRNFDWKINLEGSQNNAEWFTILKDYRILSIKNNQTDYQFTDLNFPDASYSYYRIHIITSNNKANLTTASITKDDSELAINHTFSTTSNESTDKKTKRTILDLSLKNKVPVSQLNLSIDNDYDYFRSIVIKYVTDSTETPKGWINSYRTVYTGSIKSYETNTYNFESIITNKLRVEILNNDNSPLSIGSVEIKGYKHTLISRFTEPANYFLVYGKSNDRKPNYDIGHSNVQIPVNASSLTLGETQTITKASEIQQTPLFESMTWLWAILGVIIILLGWFSLKMMSKSSTNE